MKRILITFLIIPFISCNTTDGGRPFRSDIKIFRNPYITGEITNIAWKKIGQDSVFTVLIEENPTVSEPLESEGKKIILSVRESTRIFTKKDNRNIYDFERENLKVGQKASAWLMNEIILTSYPTQGGASRILAFEE